MTEFQGKETHRRKGKARKRNKEAGSGRAAEKRKRRRAQELVEVRERSTEKQVKNSYNIMR